MKAKDLKNSILQMAVQGKLVPQDPSDEPASVLLERIRNERAKLIKEKKIKAPKNGESVIYRASDGSHYEKRIDAKGCESEPVCIDAEIPFEIPDTWEWVRICNVAEVQLGKMLDKQKNQGSPKPYLGNINVQWSRFDLAEVKSMLFRDEELEKFRLHRGDLMICEGGVPGRCAIWASDEEMYYQKAIHRVRCIPFALSAEYCRFVIDLIVNSHAQDNEFTGTTIKHLPARVLEKWKIPLPPLSEQQRIVQRLFELILYIGQYGKLENARELLDSELSDRLRKSVLQQAVEGKLVPQDPNDEPASMLLERIREEKRQLIAEGKAKAPKGGESVIYRSSDGGYYEKCGKGEPVCIDDEIPFEVPESWEWCRLSSVVLNRQQETPNVDFCYIDIGSIDNVNQKLNSVETVVAAKDAPSRARKPVEKGDVLYSTVRPYLHNICIINCEFSHRPIASTGFAVMVCPEGLFEEYLLAVLISPFFDTYANDNENSKGVAYPAINDSRLYRALIPIPPTQEQKRVVAQISGLKILI